MPFEGRYGDEASDLFCFYFQSHYPDIQIIERRQLTRGISEQDLLPSRLNPQTRAKIGRVLGVQALVLGNIDAGRNAFGDKVVSKLIVENVDTETGIIYDQAMAGYLMIPIAAGSRAPSIEESFKAAAKK